MRRRGAEWTFLVLGGLAAAALLASAAAGCSGPGGAGGQASSPEPRAGGTFYYPLQENPGPFDPTGTPVGDTAAVLHQIYECLVRYEVQPDGSMKTVPCLAQSWHANADATEWVFELRRGVLFQPPVSREVTAHDVVADLRYMADPAHGAETSYMLAGIKGTDGSGYATSGRLGVKALDRYTVRFTLERPISEFGDMAGGCAYWVWPVDYARRVGMKAYGGHPVGTGPYLFLRQKPGRSVDLARNPEWWDASGGPYLDAIHFEVYSSVSSMMLAFQKGSLDWTWVPKGQTGAVRALPQVKSGEWRAVSTPVFALGYLAFNMNDPVVGDARGLKLRQALSYGCDRQAVVDQATDGVFRVADSLVPPGVYGSSQASTPYSYDPAKAATLLEETGPVTLRVEYPVDRLGAMTARILTASYAKLGITVKARGVEWDSFLRRGAAGKCQAVLLGWVADYPPLMDNFLYPQFESHSSPASMYTFYSSPEVDALLAKARSTPDRDARVQLYLAAERKIMADAPVVPVFVFASYRLSSSRIAGARFDAMDMVDLWRAWVR